MTAAYDWSDLGHGFHMTKQGVRYTNSEPARPAKILARLLKLNHERYAEEVKQGLHEKKGRGARGEGREKAKEKKGNGRSLFDGEGESTSTRPPPGSRQRTGSNSTAATACGWRLTPAAGRSFRPRR